MIFVYIIAIGAAVAVAGAFAPENATVALIQLGNTIVAGAIGALVAGKRNGRDRDTKETPILGR